MSPEFSFTETARTWIKLLELDLSFEEKINLYILKISFTTFFTRRIRTVSDDSELFKIEDEFKLFYKIAAFCVLSWDNGLETK